MLLVNIGIIVTISIVLNLLGFGGMGGSAGALAVFCLVWGMAGSFASLLLSKFMAKLAMGVVIVDPQTTDSSQSRLLDTVRRAAQNAGLEKIPEVGIYESPEMNAFATGPSRNNSLVAVSSGLLNSMSDAELEGVIGHEVAHIVNGDMVTMTLLQGVVNALVMFVARIFAGVISNSVEERSRYWLRFLLITLFELAFGVLGVMLTSWFSRRREYRADAGSAHFVGRDKMIAALEALKNRNRVVDERAPELATFKISGKRSGGLLSLMMSHPPLESRLEALRLAKYT